jgi:hypothetical protein
LLVGPVAMAQQPPPAWSPAPFANPTGSNIPVNKLRSNTQETNAESPVLRWKVVNPEDQGRSTDKSFSQALGTNDKDAHSVAQSNVVRQPMTQSMAQSQPLPNQPRSTFKLDPPRTTTANDAQVKFAAETKSSAKATITIGERGSVSDQGVSLASYNSGSAETNPSSSSATVGVWYDRKAGANDSKSNAVQRTRFQETGLQETGDVMPSPAPSILQLPPASPGESAPTLNPQAAPELSLQQEIPSPFPKSKSPEVEIEDSPSDASEPPPISRRDNQDLAPKPPSRPNRSSVDCDSIRQLAKDQQDISKIRVDSSPNFVEGYKGKNQRVNTKEAFLNSAEVRTWYDYDGVVIAEGKLVDIERGMAIIEREDGSRVSSLLRKLSDADNAYISQAWGVPVSCSIEDRSFPRRDFLETTMTFKASGSCHKPLYFEEVQLERYGHEWGPLAQPVLSSAHFFGNVAFLPYKMGIHPMNECQYALGYYRPGSCAPWTVGPVPISLRGAWMQAKVVTGAALALP